MDSTCGAMAIDREEDSGIESTAPDPTETSEEESVYIRIAVPDLKAQKCLQFHLDDTVWMAKQRVMNTIARELRDSINYGLYCPPMNGRAGKFLDEERPLRDYPLPGPIGFLEFKYKRRVYKLMILNARKLRQLHTKANLKQFFEAVKQSQHDKVTKFLTKGLDPNFHDHETGETPLTQSTSLEKPKHMIISLVSGGSHLDFRNREGLTPMHKAAVNGSKEAIKTLLDLGSSPNYKDARGLTPLYHSVMHNTNAHCVEMLLHDHSVIGISDERGWSEVHQACKYGHVQHLEHLLFYGSDMNIQNSSGNTPLHVAAVNNQESCARVLLFRGAEKSVLNYANQDAFQVAVIAANNELAEIIKSFKSEDVVPFQEVPKYNDKRRATLPGIFTLQRCRSDPRLNLSFADSKPSSPCLSNNSFPHYISNGSLCDSPSSSGVGGSSGAIYRKGSYQSDSPRSMSISSAGSISGLSGRVSVTSDSVIYSYPKQRLYAATPGRKFICVKSYKPLNESELALKKGQIVEVVSIGEGGYWEGRSDNLEGWFPSSCVEEVRMRRRASAGARSHCASEDTVLVNRSTLAALVSHEGENAPRTVVLQKGKSGFGFVLRGAKAQAQTSPTTLEFTPTPEFPALQYLDRVDKGSAADRAGLKPGDFVLEINNELVVNATHEHTVRLIKTSGDTLAMKVITARRLSTDGLENEIHMDGTRTLPVKRRAGPAPPRRNPLTSLTASKANEKSIRDSLAELEKLDDALAQYEDTAEGEYHMNLMAQRKGVDAANKTASIRSRHSSSRLTAFELEDIMSRQDSVESDSGMRGGTLTRPARVAAPVAPKIYNSVSHMKNKGHSSSLNRASSTPNLAPNGLTPYGMASAVEGETYSRHITRVDIGEPGTLTRSQNPAEHTYAVPVAGLAASKKYGSVEHVVDSHREVIPPPPREPAPKPPRGGSGIPPPPNHPPPLPPHEKTNGEVVKISTSTPTYANISQEIAAQKKDADSSFESSFRPGINARLVREPRELPATVGPPRMSHSRTNSSISSNSSNQSERITVQGAREKFESGGSPVVAAAAATKYYEPEPDYDTPATPEVQSPSVKSVREQWAARDSKKAPSQPPPPPPVQTQPDYLPDNDRESSPFSNAIKAAAVKREQRRKSEESIKYKAQESPPPSHVKRQISKPSAPPPPPPPPPASTPPRQPDSFGRKVPPQVQQQLDANKKLEDSHAALMQAIAKRRNLVDNKEHASKEHSEVRASPPPQSQASVAASTSSTTSRTEESQEETNFRAMAERARQEWLQKKAEGTLDRRKNNPSPVRVTTPEQSLQNNKFEANKENAPKNPPPPPPIKHSPSPPRKTECSPKVTPQRQNGNNNNGSVGGSGLGDLASMIAQRAIDRKKAGVDIVDGTGNRADQTSHSKMYKGSSAVSSGPNSTHLNQTSPESSSSGVREQLSQEPRVHIQGATVDSSNTEKDSVQKEADKETTMSVAARTKMFEASKLKKSSPGPPTSSKPGGKTVYKAGSPSKLPFDLPAPVTDGNDHPPPMVPPPPPMEFSGTPSGLDIISNGSHANGHETVGWVINSSPSKVGYYNGTRPNELHLNGSHNGSQVAVISHSIPEPDIDIPFIPPPPLFDTEMEHAADYPLTSVGRVIQDDAASMVSSLSTLSTLSSNEQDSCPGADSSGGFSVARTQRNTGNSEPQILDIAPPPGFDDYVEISNENHYEELPVVNDFIPPPMGFDVTASIPNTRSSSSAYAVSNISNLPQQNFESKSIETWTVNDVSDWLMSLQLGELRHRFMSNRVNGRRLSLMGRNDLIALGVTQVGHRMTLERAIKKAQMNR